MIGTLARALALAGITGMAVVTWAIYRYDKWCARHNSRRVRERTLLLLAGCGGALGALAAMYGHAQRHKTRKGLFVAAVWSMALGEAAILAALARADLLAVLPRGAAPPRVSTALLADYHTPGVVVGCAAVLIGGMIGTGIGPLRRGVEAVCGGAAGYAVATFVHVHPLAIPRAPLVVLLVGLGVVLAFVGLLRAAAVVLVWAAHCAFRALTRS